MSFSTFPATWWFQSWSSRNRTGQRMLSQTCFFFWSFNFMNFANRWHRRGIGKLCFYLDFWLVENVVHWYWIRDWRTADWLKIGRRKFCLFIEFDLWLTLFHCLMITWRVIWGHFVRTIGHFCPSTPCLIRSKHFSRKNVCNYQDSNPGRLSNRLNRSLTSSESSDWSSFWVLFSIGIFDEFNL